MNSLGLTILAAVIAVVVSAPRQWALLGVMAGVMFLTQGQSLDLLGFNLYAVRIVEVAGFLRVILRRELTSKLFNPIDRAVLLSYGVSTVIFVLRSSEGAAYHIGTMTDAFLSYFICRGLITGLDEFRWFLRAFLMLLVPFTMVVLYESFSTTNLFTALGAVRAEDFMRAGRLRCQGSFRHPVLMGTLGSSFFPLYVGLFFGKRDRILATVGVLACAAIVWASNSGGPAGCAVVGIFGWYLWRWRTRMQFVRRVMVGGIIAVALVMKAPVWYLLARGAKVTGGGGWHRAYLIDTAFQHLSQWWLVGMPIKDTESWFPYVVPATGGADMTNAYISVGVASGLVGIALLIALLVCAYSRVGIALSLLRQDPAHSIVTEFMLWSLGVMLTVHVINWLGITYFDQIYVVWFLQLAAISTLADQVIHASLEINEAVRSEQIPETESWPSPSMSHLVIV